MTQPSAQAIVGRETELRSSTLKRVYIAAVSLKLYIFGIITCDSF